MKGLSFVSERGLPPSLRRDAGVFLMVRHYSGQGRGSSSSCEGDESSCGYLFPPPEYVEHDGTRLNRAGDGVQFLN